MYGEHAVVTSFCVFQEPCLRSPGHSSPTRFEFARCFLPPAAATAAPFFPISSPSSPLPRPRVVNAGGRGGRGGRGGGGDHPGNNFCGSQFPGVGLLAAAGKAAPRPAAPATQSRAPGDSEARPGLLKGGVKNGTSAIAETFMTTRVSNSEIASSGAPSRRPVPTPRHGQRNAATRQRRGNPRPAADAGYAGYAGYAGCSGNRGAEGVTLFMLPRGSDTHADAYGQQGLILFEVQVAQGCVP